MNIDKIINMKRNGRSIILENLNISAIDINEFFNNMDEDIRIENNIKYFNLYDYNIIWRDFILGIQYIKDNEKYYMILATNSRFSPIRQIAIGKSIDSVVYMMYENYDNTSLNVISFNEKYVNTKTNKFIPRTYRNTAIFDNNNLDRSKKYLSNKGNFTKCINAGIESIEAFNVLIDKINNKEVKHVLFKKKNDNNK